MIALTTWCFGIVAWVWVGLGAPQWSSRACVTSVKSEVIKCGTAGVWYPGGPSRWSPSNDSPQAFKVQPFMALLQSASTWTIWTLYEHNMSCPQLFQSPSHFKTSIQMECGDQWRLAIWVLSNRWNLWPILESAMKARNAWSVAVDEVVVVVVVALSCKEQDYVNVARIEFDQYGQSMDKPFTNTMSMVVVREVDVNKLRIEMKRSKSQKK